MNLYFQDLPMGKYIVCGEAHKEGHVVQANCFETVIDRLDNNSEKITVMILMMPIMMMIVVEANCTSITTVRDGDGDDEAT